MSVTIRIGLLSPNFNESRLGEVLAILPQNFTVYGFGFPVLEYTDTEFERAEHSFWLAVETIARERIECLVITGELFLSRLTHGGDTAFLEKVHALVNCPVVTMTQAVSDAFSCLGIQSVAVASPFPKEQTERHVAFLRSEGIKVVAHSSLGYRTSNAIWELSSVSADDAIQALSKEMEAADGFYFPCNLWRITKRLNELETRYGKPIVANTPAWIRAVMVELGLKRAIRNYGSLLTI